jgi:hypothetical protein
MRWAKLIAVFALLVLVVSSAPAVARADGPDYSNPAAVKGLVRQLEQAGIKGDKIWKSFSPVAQAAVIKYLHLDADGKKGQIVSVVIVPAQKVGVSSQTISPTVSPEWWCNCYEIHNVTGPSPYNQVPAAAIAQAWGPGILTLSTTKQVSNQWSANVGVSAEVVSAGVGLNVTWSSSWTYSYQINVPAGEMWEIDANNYYYRYYYDVYWNPWVGDPYKVGDGWADDFKAVTYVSRRIA